MTYLALIFLVLLVAGYFTYIAISLWQREKRDRILFRSKYPLYGKGHGKIYRSPNDEDTVIYHGNPIHLKEFTCYGCKGNGECPYVFDLYNLQGDCLAEK